MVFILDPDDKTFPSPHDAEPDGLLAIGGDLSMERLKNAYSNGIFPWYSEGEPITWYAPHERCVIFPEEIHISRSMKKVMTSGRFTFTMNESFEEVIEECGEVKRKDQDGTWITAEMRTAYIQLHRKGMAHSIEAWHEGALAGGLYGVEMNGVFSGESMFSKMSNASKACLVWLCTSQHYRLIDCQVPNSHLMSLGAVMIPQHEYLSILHQ